LSHNSIAVILTVPYQSRIQLIYREATYWIMNAQVERLRCVQRIIGVQPCHM